MTRFGGQLVWDLPRGRLSRAVCDFFVHPGRGSKLGEEGDAAGGVERDAGLAEKTAGLDRRGAEGEGEEGDQEEDAWVHGLQTDWGKGGEIERKGRCWGGEGVL